LFSALALIAAAFAILAFATGELTPMSLMLSSCSGSSLCCATSGT
jgi:hypothetical protein